MPNAHIVGEHLCLPGYEKDRPAIEIFAFDDMVPAEVPLINRFGIAPLAFEVDDVEETLKKFLEAGGSQIVIELQSWE